MPIASFRIKQDKAELTIFVFIGHCSPIGHVCFPLLLTSMLLLSPFGSMWVSEKCCSWVNRNLKKLMQSWDEIKKAAIKNKSPLLMSSFRRIRNKANKLHSELKSNTFLKEYLKLKAA